MFSRIISTGHYIPKKIIYNKDIEKKILTSNLWIEKRTGIKQRRISSKNENIIYMGLISSIRAINKSYINKYMIDMIIVSTCTSYKIFPSSACIIQNLLGINKSIAFDVQSACSGFIYSVSIADKFIKSGFSRYILIISTERMSDVIKWTERNTCVLFGDGSGSVLLSASNNPGIIYTYLESNGKYKDILSKSYSPIRDKAENNDKNKENNYV